MLEDLANNHILIPFSPLSILFSETFGCQFRSLLQSQSIPKILNSRRNSNIRNTKKKIKHGPRESCLTEKLLMMIDTFIASGGSSEPEASSRREP